MIYFSELKGKEVYTQDSVKIGKLEDLIFVSSNLPKITKLVIRDLSKNKIIISSDYLVKINKVIIVDKEFQSTELGENELFLVKNILDKQIIDIKGSKIVRVNDIAIQDKNGFYVAGVDIGLSGILRWLKLGDIVQKIDKFIPFNLPSQFLSWVDFQPLELTRGHVKLKKEELKLKTLRPEDLADYLEKTNIENVNKIIKMLDEKFASEVISNLNINYQTALFRHFPPEKAAELVKLIDIYEAVDILLTLSFKRREKILVLLNDEKRKEIECFFGLSKTPVGDLVHPDYLAVSPQNTALEVINRIKKETAGYYSLMYVYVINKENQLIGAFNLHELLLQDFDTPVYKFMIQNVIVVHLTTPIDLALRKMIKYRIVGLPVTDNNRKLIGLILHSDTSEYLRSKIK